MQTMTELTEKQYEDAAQFLNNYIHTLQSFAKTMITTLEIFKKRKVKREFLTSFHKIQYCIAKLQVIQKYSEANLKDYYRKFEDEFSEWRKMYSEIIPDNYVYDSYELLEPHYNSQYSYDPEIVSKHNLMDSESMESDILDKAVSINGSNSPAAFIVEVNSTENTQDESNEKLSETSIHESNEYASLMESESNEIDRALLKLNDIHDKSFENEDLLDENNIPPIELQTENNTKVPSQKNLESLDSINRITQKISPQNAQIINDKIENNNEDEIKSEILSQITNKSVNMELDEDNEILCDDNLKDTDIKFDTFSQVINSERTLNGEEIKSETLSQVSNLEKTLNDEEIKTEILSQASNLEKTLNDEEIKSETLSQVYNLEQKLNDEEIKTETLSQVSNLEKLSNDEEIKPETLSQASNLNKTSNHEEINPETSAQIANSDTNIESSLFGNNPQNNINLLNNDLSQIKDKVLTQNPVSVEDKLVENSEDFFNFSESEKASDENNDQIHSPNNNKPSGNEKSTNNILMDLSENSSSMDEEKMARIETQLLLTDSESIFEKNTELIDNSNLSDDLEETEQNSKNNDTSSEKDLEDIDELLSDIDISDEELKIKYKQAIKNICDDSASIESSDSEQSYNSIDNFENEALQSRSHGKIVQLNILDEKSKSSLNSDNLTDKFEKDCIVKLQRMDFSQIADNIPTCSSNNTDDDINKLLNTSALNRKRRRISTSSSNESTMRSKKKHKSPRKRKSSSSSSSSSGSDSSSSYSDSPINSDDDDFQLTDENLSDWVPDISDISSISDQSSSESSSDSSDQEDNIEKRHKSDQTKKIQNENTIKGEDENETSGKADSKNSSVDDWRNDPLLRFNLNDKKTKQKSKRNSGSSDVEIIEDNKTDDDDVIITENSNENNDKNAVNKKKHIDLREMVNRKKSVTVSISSDSDSSDESENEAEEDKTTPRKRKKKVMSYKELAEATKKANEEEKERMIRLTQRNSMSLQLSNEQGDFMERTLILEYNMETKKPRIQVHPELFKVLKDHQKEGVKFMWDSCYESIDLISKNRGSGCVLAHCMGLGKTLQIVTLLYTLFSYRETTIKRALILAPITTIKNWEREFDRWLFKLKKVFTVDSVIGKLTPEVRFRKIKTWFQNGGVFIMSYSLFRSLTTNKTNKDGVERSLNKENKVKEFCQKALLNPGPDLLICDEGHTLKNSKSAISQCISGIRTGRRIMLTGTPMQNNLKEYYCMINLVKPNLLGSAKEFANRFENPITKGQAKDSSPSEIRMMKRRAHVLHKKLSGVVQRVEGSILKPYLPSLLHYIVFIKMSNEQVTIYKKFIEIVKQIHSFRLLSTYQRAKRISTHPVCLYTRNSRTNPNIQASPVKNIDSSQLEDDKFDEDLLKDSMWYTSLYDKTQLERVECGTKLMIFFHILNQCELRGDKLLAFSTSVNILNVVEFFLKSAPIQNYINSKWDNGVDYVRVDGSTSTELRDQIYENFNDKNNQQLRLLIATTKVTGLGLNLLGANRIVILDTSWNPSDDMQSVYRIYRFGQSKDCYVYSLVSLGAMEEKIYERCVTKQAISCRVVDQQQVDRHYHSKGNVIKEFFTFVDYNQVERPAPNVPSDRVLATALHKYPDYIFSYHEHDKLLQNQEDEELDESEREAAWQEFEMEEERLKNIDPISIQLQNNQYAANQSMLLLSNQQNPMNLSNQSGTSVELQPLPNYLNPMNYVNQLSIQNNLLRQQNLNRETLEQRLGHNEGTRRKKKQNKAVNRIHNLENLSLENSNELAITSMFFNKLSEYKQATSNNVLRNINNHQNIPSTSKESDLNEPEYILSDPLDIDRLEIMQQSNNEPNKNDGNPFVNENRFLIDSINNFNELQTTTLEQNGDSGPNFGMPDPDIEMDVVVIED